MKKFLIIAAAAYLLVPAAYCADYNDAGCGLGSMIWPKNTKGQQIIAATTNGIGSQPSAISSATSDCREGSGMARLRRERRAFVATNFRQLSRELALGSGEYASSFASLMGCRQEAIPEFLSLTKSRYAEMFSDGKISVEDFLKAVELKVVAHPALSLACSS